MHRQRLLNGRARKYTKVTEVDTSSNTMSIQHLRHLAIFVDEPDPGCYYWVLIESKHDASVWGDIASSEESFDTWQAAYDAGTIEMMGLVHDQATGPMTKGEDENASPVG